jgi:hypothetical protein
MNARICLITWSFLVWGATSLYSQDFLKTDGKRIVDGKGNEVILRGMGLGGWMLQEGYMLQIHGTGMQHTIRARIADLIGREKCDAFYDLWLQNHMTRADADSLARWGFNSIRLPMHYNLFTLPIEDEPIQGKHTWLTRGFALTDSLLAWCKANKLYLILDLHAAPGGQGKDANISDYDESKPSLWESELNRQKTVALWRRLAERYASEPWIGGYDLINEPNWTFEGKNRNGLEDSLNQPIWDLYREITKTIREVDKNHIIILEGNGWGNNYRGFPGPWDDNSVLSFHKYWSPNPQESVNWVLALRDRYNMPVWLGESGENSNKWFTDCIALMERNHIGWTWWPLKKINSVVCPLMIVAPKEYTQLTDYWNNNAERPSAELATRALFEIAANLRAEKCRFNKDVIDAMFRQRTDPSAIPFLQHSVPGRIHAVDFDLGYPGNAYVDSDDENTGEEGKTDGNKGYLYRNDGVDIERCNDTAAHTNGYNVGYIEAGEWIQFTVTCERADTYDLYARVASKDTPGKLQVILNGNLPSESESESESESTSAPVPITGDYQHWQTITLGKVSLPAGTQTIRVMAETGGFNLNYIEFR